MIRRPSRSKRTVPLLPDTTPFRSAGGVEGNAVAHSLNQFPNAFPPLFRATVEAGEQSGKLDNILERLADYVERRQQLQSRVSLALIYPVILTVDAIGVVIALLTYVVPQVVGVFDSIGAQLPLLTRALIALSNFQIGRAHV